MEIDAIAFDAFGTLFDLGDLEAGFKQVVVPWTWHATVAGRFRPLPEIVESAGIDPARLSSFPLHGDVREGLEQLRGIPLAILSNGTLEGIRDLAARTSIEGCFTHLLAADQVRRYKPAAEVYELAAAAFGLAPSRVLLVSGNEWDLAGGAQHGLRTAWIARGRVPAWVLGAEPDVVAADIPALASVLRDAGSGAP